MTAPKAPITIGIIVTFMFHSFYQFPSKVQVLILLFIFFQFYSEISRDSEVLNSASSLLLLLIIIKSGPLAEIRGSVCMFKSHRNLCLTLWDRCWVIDIIIIYEFFIIALAIGLSLESEWQQISPSFQDSSQCSSRSYNVVCINSILPLISYSLSLLSKPLWILPNAPATIAITVTLIFIEILALCQDQCVVYSYNTTIHIYIYTRRIHTGAMNKDERRLL